MLPRRKRTAAGASLFKAKGANSKLSPVRSIRVGNNKRLVIEPPFVALAYTSIAGTCPSSCEFKENGCSIPEGATKKMAKRLDVAARGFTADQISAELAKKIDR